MIIFVSGATAVASLYPDVGELIVPGAGNAPDSLRLLPGMWAMDNGAYGGFDVAAFMRMLERFCGRRGCRFVAAPDVLYDARATLDQWPFWSAVIRGVGFVPALVAQDGLIAEDVPWRELGALFIGGSTEWKLSPPCCKLMAYAKARGLWVHVGRVNTENRIWSAVGAGADSCDGTSFSMFSRRRIPEALEWIEDAEQAQLQPLLIE
jgi:hypothetical protein